MVDELSGVVIWLLGRSSCLHFIRPHSGPAGPPASCLHYVYTVCTEREGGNKRPLQLLYHPPPESPNSNWKCPVPAGTSSFLHTRQNQVFSGIQIARVLWDVKTPRVLWDVKIPRVLWDVKIPRVFWDVKIPRVLWDIKYHVFSEMWKYHVFS